MTSTCLIAMPTMPMTHIQSTRQDHRCRSPWRRHQYCPGQPSPKGRPRGLEVADRAFSAFGVVLATHHVHAVGQGEVLGEPAEEREAHPHRQEDVDHVFVEEDIADVRDEAHERFDHGMHHDRNQGDSATPEDIWLFTLTCASLPSAPISPAIAWAMLNLCPVGMPRRVGALGIRAGWSREQVSTLDNELRWSHVIHGTSWSIDTCCRNCCKTVAPLGPIVHPSLPGGRVGVSRCVPGRRHFCGGRIPAAGGFLTRSRTCDVAVGRCSSGVWCLFRRRRSVRGIRRSLEGYCLDGAASDRERVETIWRLSTCPKSKKPGRSLMTVKRSGCFPFAIFLNPFLAASPTLLCCSPM